MALPCPLPLSLQLLLNSQEVAGINKNTHINYGAYRIYSIKCPQCLF